MDPFGPARPDAGGGRLLAPRADARAVVHERHARQNPILPVLATRAACRYLKDMYAVFGDWMLAIASSLQALLTLHNACVNSAISSMAILT